MHFNLSLKSESLDLNDKLKRTHNNKCKFKKTTEKIYRQKNKRQNKKSSIFAVCSN
jgi:hypothetical protein